MRVLACLLAALTMAATASGQDTPEDATGPRHDGMAVGVLAIPALEGGGPWFMPAVRLSVPLTARIGADIDAGSVFGASSKYSEIRSFYAGQIRYVRSLEPDDIARYWITGLTYLKSTRLDGRGGVRNHDPHIALSIGHGWRHISENGVRVVNEVGFSGGDGYMVYVSLGILWAPPRRQTP